MFSKILSGITLIFNFTDTHIYYLNWLCGKLFTSVLFDGCSKHCSALRIFISKYDQIQKKLWIWSHLLKESLMEYFIVCTVCSVVIFWLVVLLLIYQIYICAHQGMVLESKKRKKRPFWKKRTFQGTHKYCFLKLTAVKISKKLSTYKRNCFSCIEYELGWGLFHRLHISTFQCFLML